MNKDIPPTTDAKLEEILIILRKMNKRDFWRSWGSTIHSALTLIPIALLLWSTWYFANHAQEIMKMMAEAAAKSAANYTQQQSKGLFDDFLNQYAVPKK